MVKILVCCGNGLGSSFACQIAIETVLKKLEVPCKLEHGSVSEVKANLKNFDIICAGENFSTQINALNSNLPTIFLKKLVDKKEIEEKFTPVLRELGFLA